VALTFIMVLVLWLSWLISKISESLNVDAEVVGIAYMGQARAVNVKRRRKQRKRWIPIRLVRFLILNKKLWRRKKLRKNKS